MAGNSTPEGAAHARKLRWERHHAEPEKWFWNRVDKVGGPEACWPWLGRRMTTANKYGRLTIQGRMVGAHRMALTLATGENPDGMFACHRCDNPPCCNPAHLFWGTPQDNVNDCVAKGRKNGKPRLVPLDEVGRLKSLGLKNSELAKHFNVHPGTIWKALKTAALRASGEA